MRQYELTIRIAQIHHLIEVRKYKKALAVVKTLDMRQVKGISDLNAIAEVYTKTEQFDAAKNTYLRIYKKSRTRRVLYRLIYLAIRTNALDEAEGYYQEFVAMNSSRRDALILRYRIDKASGASIEQLIEILESLKEEEYIEEWAYELAKLYFKAGHFDECRSECEDIKLWFGRGEIVDRAKRLITSIDNDEQLAYVDDRDYTVEKERGTSADNRQDVAGAEDFVFLAVMLDVGAAVFAGQNDIADFHIERNFLAVFINFAGAERHDNCFLRFFLGGIRNHDSAFDLFRFLFLFDENSVAEGTNVDAHFPFLLYVIIWGFTFIASEDTRKRNLPGICSSLIVCHRQRLRRQPRRRLWPDRAVRQAVLRHPAHPAHLPAAEHKRSDRSS